MSSFCPYALLWNSRLEIIFLQDLKDCLINFDIATRKLQLIWVLDLIVCYLLFFSWKLLEFSLCSQCFNIVLWCTFMPVSCFMHIKVLEGAPFQFRNSCLLVLKKFNYFFQPLICSVFLECIDLYLNVYDLEWIWFGC